MAHSHAVLSKELLQMLAYCPLCEKRNEEVDAEVLGADGDMRVWHIRCRTCSHALIARVLEKKGLVSSVGVVTDLSADDARRVVTHRAVSLDDVLRTHEMFSSPEALDQFLG